MGEVRMWTVLIITACVLHRTEAESVYHLARMDEACQASVIEGSTVDLVCQYFDYGNKARPCRMRSIQWQRLGVRRVTNVTDSPKYGIWEALSGWGMQEDEHISLLRVRNVSPVDLATYRCEIHCIDEDNIPYKAYHYINLCMSQKDNNQAICTTHIDNEFCSANFKNDICDLDCEGERHMFDGFDCADQQRPCPRQLDSYCASTFANGVCDQNCNMAECAWDGGDCLYTPLQFADDDLIIFLSPTAWRHSTGNGAAVDYKEIGRSLSRLLRTIVRVLPYNSQEDPMPGSDLQWSNQFHGLDSDTAASTRLVLKLDNTNCKKDCFRKAEKAAQFILAAVQAGWDPGIPIEAVAVRARQEKQCVRENNTMLQVNLRPVGDGDAAYEDGDVDTGQGGPPSWILVAAIAGGVCLLVLIIALTLVACRLRSESRDTKSHRHHSNQYDSGRIRDMKHPPGTDV